MAFDWKKPTVQMLGRWQPWHDGHTELFKKALEKTTDPQEKERLEEKGLGTMLCNSSTKN